MGGQSGEQCCCGGSTTREEDIKGQKVIAIAGGSNKGLAALAALKTNTITDLIIGESSAKQLVEKL